jgi:hypothetical protein
VKAIEEAYYKKVRYIFRCYRQNCYIKFNEEDSSGGEEDEAASSETTNSNSFDSELACPLA